MPQERTASNKDWEVQVKNEATSNEDIPEQPEHTTSGRRRIGRSWQK